MLPTLVIKLLKNLREHATLTAPVKNDYVVFGTFHTSLATSTLQQNFKKYINVANVKNIVLHEFRHSHASYLINKGVSPLVVAQRLGHSDVATTLNTYSHLYPSKQAEAVAFMENDLV